MFTEPYEDLQEIFNNEEKAIWYLINNKYIPKYDICKICNGKMSMYMKNKIYLCHNYKCRKAISPFKDTVFSHAKLPINKVLHLLNLFLLKTPMNGLASYLKIDKDTIKSYYNKFRKHINNNTKLERIGGRNKTVEVDETKIGKRKNNKGHKVDGVWVIGGIERSQLKNKVKNENRKSFFIPIEKRNISNIDEIIKKYVKKGTTINTDCWKGYNNLNNIGYKHQTVNHKKFFKDPITHVHTNGIEGTWSGIKRGIPFRNRNKKDIVNHLMEYKWRKRYRENNVWKKFLQMKVKKN